MWITGSVVWLAEERYRKSREHSQLGCFSINLVTVTLQCVAMNVTLIYALLAYFSIRQKDFSGVYMVQQRPVYIHVWSPLCSFTAYFIAWTLPVLLIVAVFTGLSVSYDLLENAKIYSCWCLPYYGNVLPRPKIGYSEPITGRDCYLHYLHFYVTSYSLLLTSNFAIVFCCMVVIYFKAFRRIRHMRLMQGKSTNCMHWKLCCTDRENMPLLGATRAMILEGLRDAKKRVFFFVAIFFVTGLAS
jgi:hypothetical protein